MTHSEFKRRLLKLQKNLRFIAGNWFASGLYLYNPRNPDADPNGLVFMCGVPSPNFFINIPKYSIKLEDKAEGGFHRGAVDCLKMLIKKKAIRADDARLEFPGWL